MNIEKKLLTSFIALCISCNLLAQDSSLHEIYLNKILYYKSVNNDSLIYYGNKLQDTKDECRKLKGMMYVARGYYQNDDYNTAEKISLRVLKITKNTNITCQKAYWIGALNRLFWIKKNQSEFQSGLNYLIQKKKVIESLETKDNYYLRLLYSTDTDIARIKIQLGLYHDAKNELVRINNEMNKIHFDPSAASYQEILLQKASILNSLGNSYLQLSIKNNNNAVLDAAMESYSKSYEISKSFNPLHDDSKAVYSLKQAKVYIAKKEFENALSSIYKSKHEKFDQSISFLKSICFANLKKDDSTTFYSYKYLELSKTSANDKKNLITTYNILANHYSKLSKIDSAFKYSELTLKEYNDFDKIKKSTLNTLYNNDIDEIKKLNQSILKKETNLRNTFIFFTIAVSFLFLLLIYFSYKKRKLLKTKLEIVGKDILPKKKYNIDKSIEAEILSGIKEMENSLSYLKSDFTIHSLAKDLNTNTSYLSAIINKNKQHTFKQYITDLRIKYLQKVLQEDKKYRNYTVQALGEKIGYTNASAFTRAFKKHTNSTPSEYVKSLD